MTDRIQLNKELEQARRTLTRQEASLVQTLAVIEAIKSPDGTAPASIVDKRHRQHNTVSQTQNYIKHLEEALKKVK